MNRFSCGPDLSLFPGEKIEAAQVVDQGRNGNRYAPKSVTKAKMNGLSNWIVRKCSSSRSISILVITANQQSKVLFRIHTDFQNRGLET